MLKQKKKNYIHIWNTQTRNPCITNYGYSICLDHKFEVDIFILKLALASKHAPFTLRFFFFFLNQPSYRYDFKISIHCATHAMKQKKKKNAIHLMVGIHANKYISMHDLKMYSNCLYEFNLWANERETFSFDIFCWQRWKLKVLFHFWFGFFIIFFLP